MTLKVPGALAMLVIILISCTAAPVQTAVVSPTAVAPRFQFSGQNALDIVVRQVAFGPRITGTAQNRQTGDYILASLSVNGWETSTQEFMYFNTPIRNIIGTKGLGSVVVLGAHYDTRRRADRDSGHPEQPVPGANDGASGVATLLELSRVLDVTHTGKQVRMVFFDAEDNGDLDGWQWLIGSTYYANSLTVTPTAVVVTDMIGDIQQDIYLETNSTPVLRKQIWSVAESLGYDRYFIPKVRWNMTDDHTPFLKRGWSAVDIIDFDYPDWHTTQDTPDKIGAESLQRVGRTLQVWLEGNN